MGEAEHGASSLWGRARTAALETIAPTRCAGCERPGHLICPACLQRIVPIDPVHACTRCGAPFGAVLCTECGAPARDGGPGADGDALEGAGGAGRDGGRCLAATVFEGPVPRIIRAYKDAGEQRLAEPIAELMLDAAEHAEETARERYGGLLVQADAVTFVPVTAAAYARRGFDHMERIAIAFSRLSGVPLVDALVKRGSADQRALDRVGRRERALDAYEVVEPVADTRMLLLDDVITTGATVHAARAALLRSGALRVDALAFARVW